MKKYIFIFAALIVSLWSCQKDLDLYSGRDFIYFNPSAGLDSTYFSFAYVDVNKEVDSLYIMVRTGGEVKDYDRQVKVKVLQWMLIIKLWRIHTLFRRGTRSVRFLWNCYDRKF